MYENVRRQGQQKPPNTTMRESVKSNTNMYSSLSPSTMLQHNKPTSAGMMTSGIYEELQLQSSSNEYQSLNRLRRV